MGERSSVAPGWQGVIEQLTAPAADDGVFYRRLLNVMTQVSAARQGVLMLPDRSEGDEVEPRAAAVWPPAGESGDEQAPVEQGEEVANVARASFASGTSSAAAIERDETYYTGSGSQGFVVGVPIKRADGRPSAVVTLLLEARSKEAIRSTVAMAELLAGYAHMHGARMQLHEMKRASFAFDLATRLIASINAAKGFKGASIQLCNDIAKQFDLDRVGLGWISNDRNKLVALSDTEHFDRRMDMVQKLEAAMDEAFDQDQPIMYPQPPSEGQDGDVLLSQAVVHAHRELASGNAGLKLASFPLRVEEEVVGVLTIESAGEGEIDVATVEMLQAAMDLIGPMMSLRRSDDRTLPSRAVVSAKNAGAWAVGPKHTVWKLVGLAVAVLLAALFLIRIDYRVTAEASIQPATKAVISMPFAGLLESVEEGIEVDKVVRAGQALAQLDTTELRLRASDARAKIAQAEKQAEEAIEEGDTGSAGLAEMQAERARAELSQIEYQIERSRVVAPIDGTIIEGDLTERVGSTLQLGEPLFMIAPLNEMIVVAKVDDRDIALVRGVEGAPIGTMATKSRPNERIPIEIEKIMAVAQADEGKNVFEVRSAPLELDAAQLRELRPGMEGLVRVRTERHSLAWIGSRRLLDMVRLWLW